MNIGLLISELEDKEVKKICIGASQAARDKEVTLVIFPGKYLVTDKDEEKPFGYQYAALFDYANTSDLDILIVDIDRIGKNVPILKRQAFLNKFANIPVLTLTEFEGYKSVNKVETDHEQFMQLGYEAVCDACSYYKNKTLPPVEPAKKFSYVEKTENDSLLSLAEISNILLNRKYETEKAYHAFIEVAKEKGLKNSGVMLFDKKVRNNTKYWWEKPEYITVKSSISNGNAQEYDNDGETVKTEEIFTRYTAEPTVLIAGALFVEEYQLGILITEFTMNMVNDYFFDSIVSVITGASRISYLEKELKKTNEELYEVQAELDRDDSVLDHIGDQDYLTGGLNRRGFFAKAYDLLKEKFVPDSYAIVAYIHMESLKSINDMYGHEEGDRAVRKVASILEDVFKGCIYGRIRGDEFAVIEITEEDGKAESFRQEMSAQNARLLDDSTRYMNHLQYSICEFSHDENLSLREMLKETDENLQRIKENR